MICESEIQERDFSIALPEIISKLDVLSMLMHGAASARDQGFFWGLGAILGEIRDDLKAIDRALNQDE